MGVEQPRAAGMSSKFTELEGAARPHMGVKRPCVRSRASHAHYVHTW